MNHWTGELIGNRFHVLIYIHMNKTANSFFPLKVDLKDIFSAVSAVQIHESSIFLQVIFQSDVFQQDFGGLTLIHYFPTINVSENKMNLTTDGI